MQRNNSPFLAPDSRKHVSPYRSKRQGGHITYDDDVFGSSRSNTSVRSGNDNSKVSEKSNYSNRSKSAPRPRSRELGLNYKKEQERVDRKSTQIPKILPKKETEISKDHDPSVGEMNEILANGKMGLNSMHAMFESTESISPGDIFFLRDCNAQTIQDVVFTRNGSVGRQMHVKEVSEDANVDLYKGDESNSRSNQMSRRGSSTIVLTQQVTNNSGSVVSGQNSTVSNASGRTTESLRKFTANRQKSPADAFFSCIKKGPCRTTNKSPEKTRTLDETAFIQKANVVESLRRFWADKYQPTSLNGFTCHKKEALVLKQLASNGSIPHILLKGPPGSGKKAVTMALLHEIFGDLAWNVSHDMRHFQIQETRPVQVFVPVSSSPHHVELNVFLEPNARYAMMALVKDISNQYSATPENSHAYTKADYKVMVLYDIDKAAESVQHLIKWIMDCYSDSCKMIMCCEDDADILEPVRSRCKIVKLDSPVTHEIMEVLIQIARKEEFELSMSFAAKIATKSKQNMRRAIMALEACKAHNYPFLEDQPIPLGWEDVVMELADEILADPYPRRLFMIRGKLQQLLQDFVHPTLILLKLVEQFLKRIEGAQKRELYYWHAYYDKRLPTGTSSLLKLEEFVAKFMSMYRRVRK
ncbi:hypothetical protein Leryth_016609 [Lithospermum erythrorhizon]|nr:hypothetical protein Leryth_016609 [Lithospermum erythrorhizon]